MRVLDDRRNMEAFNATTQGFAWAVVSLFDYGMSAFTFHSFF